MRGGLVRARRHTHRSADERAHLRADDQRGADGISRHLRAVSRAISSAHTSSDGVADTGSNSVADTCSDGRAHTGSDRVAGTGSDGVASRRADEAAHHRPHRRDAVKCT